MEQMPRFTIMAELIKRLDNHRSWCGETHIQKATYFMQELLGVPTGFDFILYKHGPFSFDLRDELAAMRTYQILELVPQPLPYGPSWHLTANGQTVRDYSPVTLAKYESYIEFIADKLGDKRVGELEKLATALYVYKQYPGEDDEQLAGRINALKPHVSIEEARIAVQEFRAIAKEAKSIVMVA